MKKILLIAIQITCIGIMSNVSACYASDQSKALDFFYANRTIDSWLKRNTRPIVTDADIKSKDFPKQGYTLLGHFSKGKLQEGGLVKICSLKDHNRIILSGIVKSSKEELIVRGVYNVWKDTLEYSLYGSFFVKNQDAQEFCYKPKNASDLEIFESSVEYFKNYNKNTPVIILPEYVFVSFDTGKSFLRSFFYSPIDYHNYNLDNIISKIKHSVNIYYRDGSTYSGTLETINAAANGDIIWSLGYGRYDVVNTDKNYSVEINNCSQDQICIRNNSLEKTFYDGKIIDKITYILPHNTQANIQDYYNNSNLYTNNVECSVEILFRNKNTYVGKFQLDGDNIQLTEGAYTYANGDKFIGNMQGTKLGNLYCDGYVLLHTGEKLAGNWLSNYTFLSEEQKQMITDIEKNPYEMRQQADITNRKEVFASLGYVDYKFYGDRWKRHLEYFDVEHERINDMSVNYITTYDDYYYCKYDSPLDVENKDPSIAFVFKMDKNGKRLEEIMYGLRNEKNAPIYRTFYEWYENGILKSLKTYSLSTNKIIFSMNFFSDGILRSAYVYSLDKNGNVILRKSKESHPTMGGYTSKLYDLNGNYERTIEWSIGEGQNIWGESVNYKFFVPKNMDYESWLIYDRFLKN